VVCVFARKTSEPLASLVKQIDKQIGENASLKSFVVIMTKDGAKTADALKKLARDGGVKNVPLTMIGEIDGPPDYEVSKDADVTVLMWKESQVKFSHGYKGELTDKDVQTIVSDIPKLLGR
jgi:predicted transcriptional regulator